MRLVVLLAVAGLLAGCASGYDTYFKRMTSEEDVAASFLPASGRPEVSPSLGDPDQTFRRMYERGYGLIGYSAFSGPEASASKALAKAREVGASNVVIFADYVGTERSAVPIFGFSQVTTQHTGFASSYGAAGTQFANYNGTSTTSVPTTTYIPTSVDQYNHMAMFFAPMKPPCLGARIREATDEEKRSVGTTQVARIDIIRNNSPAARAGLLPGDLIPTYGSYGLSPDAPYGGLTSGVAKVLRVARAGTIVEKTVVPANCSWPLSRTP